MMTRTHQKKASATKKDKFGYSGILCEPIKMGDQTSLDFDPDAELKRIGKETADRITALFNHYLATDPPSQQEGENLALWLAMKLAQKHVKGFGVVPASSLGRGESFKWPMLGARLVVDVEELVAAGKTVARACQILVKRPLYKQHSSGKPSSLRQRYYEAKNQGKLMPVMQELLFSKLPDEKRQAVQIDFHEGIKKVTNDPVVTGMWRQK